MNVIVIPVSSLVFVNLIVNVITFLTVSITVILPAKKVMSIATQPIM